MELNKYSKIITQDETQPASQAMLYGIGLTEEDLKTILNPLKPVYAGMVQDTEHNVNRFVYIKSSSFPLIPQLTKGLKLEKD